MDTDSELPPVLSSKNARTAWVIPAVVGFAVGVALQSIVMLQFLQVPITSVDSVVTVDTSMNQEPVDIAEDPQRTDPLTHATTSALDTLAKAKALYPAPYTFVFEVLSGEVGPYGAPLTRISLAAATQTGAVVAAIEQDAHIGTYPLACNDQRIDSAREHTAVFGESLSSARCWWGGGGIELGIFLRTASSGPIVSVEGRLIDECGGVAGCVPYGAMRQLYTVALDPPHIVSRPETFPREE